MRYYYNRKPTADESCDLSIYSLKKWGMLSGNAYMPVTWTSSMSGKKSTIGLTVNMIGDPYVKLVYSIADRDGNKTDYNCEVSLVTTPCNFGGIRYWFGCPYCGRRVGVIYLVPGDTYFRCRHCNNLSYQSRNICNLTALGIASRKADQLRSEIKRWTWRGMPTRKVRKLHALEWK